MSQEIFLNSIAHELRIDILRMFHQSKTGHLAPALSCIDILTVLYFGGIINESNLFSQNRDRVILSKGHACAALYAVLARVGYFPREELLTFYQKNTRLGGHPNIVLPGIETATGSLGHGICFGTGTAKAAKVNSKDYKTYVIIGDGESQEGSVWEAAMFAANQHLDNLIVILDRNGLQASTSIDEIAPLEPIKEKWQSFGWNVEEVDGHDFDAMQQVFEKAKIENEKPTIVVANTIKGKGISFAQNNPEWHSRAPKGEEWEKVCQEFGIREEELDRI